MNPLMTVKDVMEMDWIEVEVRRNLKGVYMLKDKQTGEVVYVGQTSNLGSRLCPSIHPVYRKEKHTICFFPVEDKQERINLEGHIIRVLKPKNNRRGGHLEISDKALNQCYDMLFNR